jgi:Lipocalin-like domain
MTDTRQIERDVIRQFVGTWRLVSAVQHMADGGTRNNPVYGPGGVGYILYGDTGRLCVVNIDPSRAKWVNESAPTDAELRSAMKGLIAYAGRYEVHPADGYVIHHIEVDAVPNRVGSSQKRFFEFTGNRLILRPAPPHPPGIVDYLITWERVS